MRVIAELGTFTGSVAWAHEAVDAAAEAGAWAAKIQILSPDTIVAPDAPRYDRLGTGTQYDAFLGQIARSDWPEIKAHCDEVELEFFASCWDHDAVEWCETMKVRYYKIGSGDLTYWPLIQYIGSTGKRIIMSTGAATDYEINATTDRMDRDNLILLACTLSYPCQPEDAALYRIGALQEIHKAAFYGYSDHTTLIDIGGFAVAAGAYYLEKHFTVTPGAGGDHDFALDPAQLEDYIDHAQRVYRLKFPTHLDGEILPSEEDARRLARRSLHASKHISAGTAIVVGNNARFVRPTGGIEPNEQLIDPLVAAIDIREGAPIAWTDLS